jgi:hypothetical protein
MSPEITIDVAKDFSATPGGRFRSEGAWSGEEFREKHLEPALKKAQVVYVDLDGPVGFTSSFLEEVFGGIVRVLGVEALDRVKPLARLKPHRAKSAMRYMDRELGRGLNGWRNN